MKSKLKLTVANIIGIGFTAVLGILFADAIIVGTIRWFNEPAIAAAEAAEQAVMHDFACLRASGAALNTIGTLKDYEAKAAAAYLFETVRPDCAGSLQKIVADQAVLDGIAPFAAKVDAFANSED